MKRKINWNIIFAICTLIGFYSSLFFYSKDNLLGIAICGLAVLIFGHLMLFVE